LSRALRNDLENLCAYPARNIRQLEKEVEKILILGDKEWSQPKIMRLWRTPRQAACADEGANARATRDRAPAGKLELEIRVKKPNARPS